MDTLLSIGIFIGYLIVYVIWATGIHKLHEKQKKSLLERQSSFLLDSTLSAWSVAGVFCMIWILAGYFNLHVFIIFIAGSCIGSVVTAILWAFYKTSEGAFGARAMWAGGELAIKHQIIAGILMLFSVIVTFGYPIASGYIYFTYDIPSQEATLALLRTSLLWLVLSGLFVLLPVIVGSLASSNLDENTRTRFFVAQIGALLVNALFLSLAFHAFNLDSVGSSMTLANGLLAASPMLFGALIIYFFLILLLPYTIGVKNAARKKKHLLSVKKRFIEEIIAVLSFPKVDIHGEKLRLIQAKIENELDTFIDDDKMVQYGFIIDDKQDGGELDTALSAIEAPYRKSRNLDIRFEHVDYLNNLHTEIEHCVNDLDERTYDDEKSTKSKEYLEMYKLQETNITASSKQRNEYKPAIFIGVGIVVTTITSKVLSEGSTLIWEKVLKSLGVGS